MPGGGLNEAVARTIGKPAGPGGRYAAWQFAALAGLLEARDRAEAACARPDKPFEVLGGRARAGQGRQGRRRRPARGHPPARPRRARNASDRDLLVGLSGPRSRSGSSKRPWPPWARPTDAKVAELLLPGWKRHSPQLRCASSTPS